MGRKPGSLGYFFYTFLRLSLLSWGTFDKKFSLWEWLMWYTKSYEISYQNPKQNKKSRGPSKWCEKYDFKSILKIYLSFKLDKNAWFNSTIKGIRKIKK